MLVCQPLHDTITITVKFEKELNVMFWAALLNKPRASFATTSVKINFKMKFYLFNIL